MKYIPADKLLNEIDSRIARCAMDEEAGYPDTTSPIATLKSFRSFITSLQQEQPDEDTEEQDDDKCPICGCALDAAGCCSRCGYGRR